MSFSNKLTIIDDLITQINSYGVLPNNVKNKINYKLRLDWNYYSNAIEGNTLTMQETRSIMIGNVTVNGKPVKDVMEMKGHDDVVNEILKIGKTELNLSENRIKHIHKGIMHEDDPEKQLWIGEWKTQPNYIYNFRGERFDFTAPGDVSDEMHKLINWLNTEKEKIERSVKTALHPVQIALEFHLKYITIHPFYDGNGRTARILSNLILISFGYPPFYIKTDEKNAYYQYLGEIQCYGASTDLLYDFMADLIIRSTQLTLDAIEGKEIEEKNDIDKELQLLKINVKQKEATPPNTPARPNLEEILLKYLGSFLKQLDSKLLTFRQLFSKHEEMLFFPGEDQRLFHKGTRLPLSRVLETYEINYESKNPLFHLILTSKKEIVNEILNINCQYHGIENVNEEASVALTIQYKFRKYTYTVFGLNDVELFTKNYDEFLNDEEIDTVIKIHIGALISKVKAIING
jgi:Fic family protein